MRIDLIKACNKLLCYRGRIEQTVESDSFDISLNHECCNLAEHLLHLYVQNTYGEKKKKKMEEIQFSG